MYIYIYTHIHVCIHVLFRLNSYPCLYLYIYLCWVLCTHVNIRFNLCCHLTCLASEARTSGVFGDGLHIAVVPKGGFGTWVEGLRATLKLQYQNPKSALSNGPKLLRFIVLKYGPLLWALTCFFLVWVRFEVWALILRWHIMGIEGF